MSFIAFWGVFIVVLFACRVVFDPCIPGLTAAYCRRLELQVEGIGHRAPRLDNTGIQYREHKNI